MNILLLLLVGIHSFLYFYEKRQSFRNRLSFKNKSKHQDDQSQANDRPVETIYFIGNPENGHHLEENSNFELAFAGRNLRSYVQCQETNET